MSLVFQEFPQTAITLLQNCLSSRENKIWVACGDYWGLPWAELPVSTHWSQVETLPCPQGAPRLPYKPVFLDGWSPGYVTFSDDQEVLLAADQHCS